jgi:hypothetical protein
MRILIGTENIAGWIQHYKKGFEQKGHAVTTAVYNRNSFYGCEYDYILNDFFLNVENKKEIKKNQYLKRTVRKIKNKVLNWKYEKFILRLIDEHDLLILLWNPYLTESRELAYAKSRNKKIVSIFVGSDVRYFRAFQQEFNVSSWVFPTDWNHDNPGYHLQLIRNAEKYSDLIYSVPDQSGLQLKSFYHLQVPMDIDKFVYFVPQNKIPKVLHAPSIPFKKGTDIIEATLAKLKNDGIVFELISVRNMPNHELLQLLTEADVLVDEIVYNGPGALSFEAMLSGCAVATRHIEESSKNFQPPICNIDASNIYEKLKELLTNSSMREELATKGYAYAIKYNAAKNVVEDILKNIEYPRTPDYFPNFLRYRYLPNSQDEINTINQWTNFVKDCDWYKQDITFGVRAGLEF